MDVRQKKSTFATTKGKTSPIHTATSGNDALSCADASPVYPIILTRKTVHRSHSIKTLRYIISTLAVLVAVIAIVLLLLTETPYGQKWMARVASEQLSELLDTHVEVGKMRIGLFNRLVIDDVLLRDQEDSLLLSATRISAKMELRPLLSGKVHINNIQLFGYHAVLRRPSADEPYNFQFIIDRFKNDDEPSKPLNLDISTIVIRRGVLEHHIGSVASSATGSSSPSLLQPDLTSDGTALSGNDADYRRFDYRHFRLDSLSTKVSLFALTDDSIKLKLNGLSFVEATTNFALSDLSFQLDATRSSAHIQDFNLVLPHSAVAIPDATASLPSDSLADASLLVPALTATVCPREFTSFLPQLAPLSETYHIDASGAYRNRQLALTQLDVESDGLHLNSRLWGRLQPTVSARVELEELEAAQTFIERLLPLIGQSSLEPLTKLGDIRLTGRADYAPDRITADLQTQTALGNAQVQGSLLHRDNFDVTLKTQQLSLRPIIDKDITLADGDIHASGSIKAQAVKATVQARGFQWADQQLKLGHIGLDAAMANRHITGHAALGEVNFKDTALGDLDIESRETETGRSYRLQTAFLEAQAEGEMEPTKLFITCNQMLHETLPSLFVSEATPQSPKAKATDGGEGSLRFDVHLTDAQPIAKITGGDFGIGQPVHLSGVMDSSTGVIALEARAPHVSFGSEELTDLSLSAYEQADSIRIRLDGNRQMESGPLRLGLIASAAADSLRASFTWDNQLQPAIRGELAATTHFFRDERMKLGADIHLTPSQMLVSDTVWNVHPATLNFHDGKIDVSGFTVSQWGRHLKVDGTVSPDEADTLYADLLGINLQYVFGLIDFHDVEFAGLASGAVKARGLMNRPIVDADLRIPSFYLNDGLLGQLHVTGGWGHVGPKTLDLEGHIIEPTHGEESVVKAVVTPGHDVGSGLELDIFARRVNAYFVNFFTEGIFQDLQGSASGYAHLYGPFGELELEGDIKLDTAALSLDVLGSRYHLSGDSLLFRPGRIIIPGAYVLDTHASYVPAALKANRPTAPAEIPIPHCGYLKGEVRHNHFDVEGYRFDVLAHEMLGYDFHDFGDQVFYGTVYADGHVRLDGRPGTLNVDIEGSPTAGTSFTYNASNPDISTDNAFIRFVEHTEPTPAPATISTGSDAIAITGADATASSGSDVSAPAGSAATSSTGSAATSSTASAATASTGLVVGGFPADTSSPSPSEPEEESDMRINFNLDITPAATMRILMDARSGDYITLAGDGHIRANFYNKGAFQMYGTYHVDHGTYKLSLQDVIRKDFQIQRGSTLTFGGAPMKGDLDLRAIYTVPSVSLNDLAAGANFSNSTVRVNCIMNIGGRAEQPQVSFDFDIPNVNEDEKQMVRSLISTDEERNLQVIYLLGIGRFYTYGAEEAQDQANSAVNSLLSSTISGQINEYLGRAIGQSTRNWNFGTSLSTGSMGWNDMDVEGMLSGRLLDNRLLLNGTFGYRDTPVANTNFIGDFDVQYLLTRNGNVSLKAYSETNDRYFTKTALTTQGIGIVLKKDFNTFHDLFNLKK